MTPAPRVTRPPHRSPGLLLGVLVGGVLGTGLRTWISLVLPHAPGEWPLGTFAVNVVGSGALGALLQVLSGRPDTGRPRAVRLAVGSGVLGGFTTTSALALETALLLERGDVATGLAYAGTSLVLGLAAAAVGVRLAGGLRRGGGR